MRIIYLSMIIACAAITGCASNPMLVATNQTLSTPSSNEAQVVFMRSAFVGSAISASLFDVSTDETKFIGIINNATKVVHKTTPGKHVYMVVSEAADFLEANLIGGKTYYSIVTPRMGAWKARFSLWPIKSDPNADYSLGSNDFQNWLKSTKIVENSPASLQWFENNKTSVDAKRKQNWAVWEQKTPDDLARRTLSPEDGR